MRLMAPEYVQPYVKAQENDDRDAEAIAEAATRPTMRFVELEDEAQLDMQTLHRARTRLVNQMRAILLERGMTVAKGRRARGIALARLLDGETLALSRRMRTLLADMRTDWASLDARIQSYDRGFVAHVDHVGQARAEQIVLFGGAGLRPHRASGTAGCPREASQAPQSRNRTNAI